jgi:hypothetical protein
MWQNNAPAFDDLKPAEKGFFKTPANYNQTLQRVDNAIKKTNLIQAQIDQLLNKGFYYGARGSGANASENRIRATNLLRIIATEAMKQSGDYINIPMLLEGKYDLSLFPKQREAMETIARINFGVELDDLLSYVMPSAAYSPQPLQAPTASSHEPTEFSNEQRAAPQDEERRKRNEAIADSILNGLK